MIEGRLKLAVFIDFDNIQIGVKDTLGKEFDVALVLEALKERGEVVTKVAYGDWHRAGEHSRQMTQHAVQMVQRNVTPRGDKNGADINLALDALEMAFNRPHIDAFAIVGGDSDFIALVEKLKQYDKRVLVVGGRAFTSNILQRNCHEFIAYENLLKSAAGGDGGRVARSARAQGRAAADSRPLSQAVPNVQRALKVLAEREVAPQIGLLKSTLLQLDPTFSERDYGAGSFLEFMQKMEQASLARLRKTERGFLVEPLEETSTGGAEPRIGESDTAAAVEAPEDTTRRTEALAVLKQALVGAAAKVPNRPLYLRHVRQALRVAEKDFDERKYGFRSITDLLHQAQREGQVRLQRDRKGALRVFPVTAAPATDILPLAMAEPAAGTAESTAVEFAPAETDVLWEETAKPEEELTVEEVMPEPAPAVDAEAAGEAPAEPKTRRTRATRGSGRSRPRKTAPRKKTSDE